MATSPRSSHRRRQRSVRLTLAASLLSVAAVLVVVAVSIQAVILLNVAAVGALLLGAAAVRVLHTELLHDRRAHAADRSAQARAYRRLSEERVAENATFTDTMTERLAASVRAVRELEGTLLLAERRVAESEQAAGQLREALEARVAELAEKAEQVRTDAAAHADERAAEEAELYAREAETIVDLLAWDQRFRPTPAPALKQA